MARFVVAFVVAFVVLAVGFVAVLVRRWSVAVLVVDVDVDVAVFALPESTFARRTCSAEVDASSTGAVDLPRTAIHTSSR